MFVISHRGANRLAPENTLPAFEKSLNLGVDGFENDVHLTRDGAIVVCHNDTIDSTSNGRGAIRTYTLQELREFDFGSWFSPEFSNTKIPTLEEFYNLCSGLQVINVEIKREADGCTDAAGMVLRLAREMGLSDRLIISSFDLDMLAACRAADPEARTCFLYAPTIEEDQGMKLLYAPQIPDGDVLIHDPVTFAKRHHLYAFHPFFGIVDQIYLDACHAGGIAVNPWTVNQEHALKALRDWGSDGVITDEPELALAVKHGI